MWQDESGYALSWAKFLLYRPLFVKRFYLKFCFTKKNILFIFRKEKRILIENFKLSSNLLFNYYIRYWYFVHYDILCIFHLFLSTYIFHQCIKTRSLIIIHTILLFNKLNRYFYGTKITQCSFIKFIYKMIWLHLIQNLPLTKILFLSSNLIKSCNCRRGILLRGQGERNIISLSLEEELAKTEYEIYNYA